MRWLDTLLFGASPRAQAPLAPYDLGAPRPVYSPRRWRPASKVAGCASCWLRERGAYRSAETLWAWAFEKTGERPGLLQFAYESRAMRLWNWIERQPALAQTIHHPLPSGDGGDGILPTP